MDILFTTIRDVLYSLFPSMLAAYGDGLDLIAMILTLAIMWTVFVVPLASLFRKKRVA